MLPWAKFRENADNLCSYLNQGLPSVTFSFAKGLFCISLLECGCKKKCAWIGLQSSEPPNQEKELKKKSIVRMMTIHR